MKIAQTIVLILACAISLTFVGLVAAGMLVAEKKVERPKGSSTNGFFDEISLAQEMGNRYYSKEMADEQQRSAKRVAVLWLFGLIFVFIGIVIDRWHPSIATGVGASGLMLMMIGGVTGYFVFETEFPKLSIWLFTAALCILALFLLSLTNNQSAISIPTLVARPEQQTYLAHSDPVQVQTNSQPTSTSPGQIVPADSQSVTQQAQAPQTSTKT